MQHSQSANDQTPNCPTLIAECFHFMEFRLRNYITENQSHALPRLRADAHPLSPPPQPVAQVNVAVDGGNVDFFDPLRGGIDNDAKATPLEPESLSEVSGDQPTKEWTSFRRILMQRFPV